MANDIYRRCGCRDAEGKQLGKNCPQLADPKHGTWGYYVSAGKDPKTGKRIQHRKAGFRTEREARIERNKVAVKIDSGTFVRPTRKTVADYLNDWLPRRQKTGKGLKPTTLSNYRRYIDRDITPTRLGQATLTEVRRHHVNAFITELIDDGRGAVTIHRIAAVLKTAFAAAVKDGLMETNPAADVDLPRVEDKDLAIWEPEQVGHFLDVAGRHRLGALFELVMFTGLRRGEVTGLRWEDVDLFNNVLMVRQTRVQADGKVIDQNTAKNKASRALVELESSAVGALMAWQIRQDSEREAWGELWTNTGYVFTMEDGRPVQPTYVTRLFEKLRVEAGLPKMTFHGARHEHASLLIASGADIAVVSKRLRHSNLATTANTYTHLIASASRNAAEGAAALVPRNSSPVHTLHTQDHSERMEKAPAGTGYRSDKGLYRSPLPDSNRRPPVYKTGALAN